MVVPRHKRSALAAQEVQVGAFVGLQQQYIVTMNSDIFDRLPVDKSVDLRAAVLGTRLSDETEDGGLFGFRFG